MPRININEKDRTSPGTPGGYSNNTVLIAGFSAYTDEEIEANVKAKKAIAADDNGIFEFESSDDFENTIGCVAPEHVQTGNNDEHLNKLPAHYGNQMAYELLKMGYPVIYINLGTTYKENKDDVDTIDIADKMKKLGSFADTWKIFTDKASYDFRFISHGLLTASEIAKSDNLVNLEARAAKMSDLFDLANIESGLVRFEELVALNGALDEQELEEYDKFFSEVSVLDETTNETITRRQTEDEVRTKLKEDTCIIVKEFENTYMYDKNRKPTAVSVSIGYTEKKFDKVSTYQEAEKLIEAVEAEVRDAYKAESTDTFTDADFAAANAAIAKLAHYKAVVDAYGNEDEMDKESGRGDCIALVEVDESQYTIKDGTKPENLIVNAINAMSDINSDNGKYCACTVPSVVYKITADKRFGGNKKFPGAFHYLACLKNSLGLGFAEWYAAAGYTRGVSSYVVDHTTVKLGEIAIQALEPRNIEDQNKQPKFAVNVIANFRGSYYLWGNRTCHPLGDAAGGNDLVASHFLNIRQLCTTIKKQLYVSCRRFTFDPNSDVLWINFKNSITPMLDRMKADQGVRDYKIEKVYTDKKATLKAKIRIVPIEAVEDFLLEVSLEDSLGETAVTVTE